MVWIFYILLVVFIIYCSYAAAGGANDAVPHSLRDVQAPTAEQGRAIPVAFGTCIIKGSNVVWYGDLRTEPIMS